MANYTFNNGAVFPNSIMEKTNFEDVLDADVELINQIQSLKNNGRYEDAATLEEANKSRLEKITINGKFINKLNEEVRNSQIFAKKKEQYYVVSETEPEYTIPGLVWIKPIN